jgi:hypothetical protein
VHRASGLNTLATVRASYLDVAQWAVEETLLGGDPVGGACPIRAEEMSRKKEHHDRKSRMDQRTRDHLPVLPRLIASVDGDRTTVAALLQAARATSPEATFRSRPYAATHRAGPSR